MAYRRRGAWNSFVGSVLGAVAWGARSLAAIFFVLAGLVIVLYILALFGVFSSGH